MIASIEHAIDLPQGWSHVRLTDVGSFLSGSGFPIVYQGSTSGDLPFFKVSDFSNNGNERTLHRANHYIDRTTRKKMGARIFPKGAIAFAKIGAAIFLERKRVIEQDSCLDNNMAAFVLASPQVSRDLILAHFQNFSLGSLVSSTALPAISSTDLKSIAFPLPDDPKEQEAIAEALSDADALIEGLERLIAKKRLIKQGAMQDLLTAKRRLPGFSEVWASARLGEFSQFLSGTYLAKSAYRCGSIVVQGAGAPMGEHNEANFPFAITVIGRVGTVGRPRFMPKGCWVNNNAAAIKAAPLKAEPKFVHLLLDQLDWSLATSTTAQPFLGIGALMNSVHSLPPKCEQAAIAESIFDMDAEIQALEARLNKAQQVKEGMMQNLLTGRIRLV